MEERDVFDADGNVVGKETVWGRKWKKRVWDAKEGMYRFIDYDRDERANIQQKLDKGMKFYVKYGIKINGVDFELKNAVYEINGRLEERPYNLRIKKKKELGVASPTFLKKTQHLASQGDVAFKRRQFPNPHSAIANIYIIVDMN